MKKVELAKEYFPDADAGVACDKLRRWINRCTQLLTELAKTGYNTYDKEFTPRQVELIKEYLGDP